MKPTSDNEFVPLSDAELEKMMASQSSETSGGGEFVPFNEDQMNRLYAELSAPKNAGEALLRHYGVREEKPWGSLSDGAEPSAFSDFINDVASGFVGNVVTPIGDTALSAASAVANAFSSDKEYDFNRAARASGYWTPEKWQEDFQKYYSDDRLAKEAEYERTEGPLEAGKVLLSNPSLIFGRLAQSSGALIPVFGASKVAGAAALARGTAQGLAGKELSKHVLKHAAMAGSAAEGVEAGLGVSQAIGTHNIENGKNYTSANQLYSLPVVAGTMAAGMYNPMEAMIATRGIREAINTGKPVSLLASVKGMAKRGAISGNKEGIEETVQSVNESGWQNVGEGKNYFDNAGKTAVESYIVGGAMGVGMHPFTNRKEDEGTFAAAVNNGSQTQQPVQEQPRQAIPLLGYDRPLGADGSGGVMVGPGSDSPSPRMSLNPEEQAQTTEAIRTGVANPTAQAQQSADASPFTQGKAIKTPEEEKALRDEYARDYGGAFEEIHGTQLMSLTMGQSKDFRDFHHDIIVAGEAMKMDPFKADPGSQISPATKFAEAFNDAHGDKAVLAKRYRNLGLELEQTAPSQSGAQMKRAEFYQQLADLLEGKPLMGFQERRAMKKEQAAKAAAETQAAQVQQTAEQMKAQEPAPVEVKPEVEAQPEDTAQTGPVITAEEQKLVDSEEVPTGEALNILSPSQRRRVYEAHVNKLVAAGKIGEAEAKAMKVHFPKDKEKGGRKFVQLWDIQQKRLWEVADQEKAEAFRARLNYIGKADLGIARGMKAVSNQLENVIAKRDPDKLDEFISKNENRIQAKIRLANAVNDGVSEERLALIEKWAKDAKTEQDWARVNKALMDEGATDALGVAPKETVVKTNKDGVVEVESVDSAPSAEDNNVLLEKARKKLDKLLKRENGSYEEDDEKSEKMGVLVKGALTPKEEETLQAFGTDEDRANLNKLLLKDQNIDVKKHTTKDETKGRKNTGEELTPEKVEEAKKKEEELKKVQAQAREKRGELYRKNWNELDDGEKLLVAQSLGITHNNLSTGPKKRTEKTDKILGAVLRDDEKKKQFAAVATEELNKAPKPEAKAEAPVEVIEPKETGKVDFSKKLENADKSRTEEMKAAEDADKAAAKEEAKKPEPTVINGPAPKVPEDPFEKKEAKKEAPKKAKADAKEQAEKAKILSAMERYLNGGKRGVSMARAKKLQEMEKRGLLTEDEKTIVSEYLYEREKAAEKAKEELNGKTENGIHASLSDDAQLKASEDIIEAAVEQVLLSDKPTQGDVYTGYSSVTSDLIQRAKKNGLDFRGFVHAVSTSGLTHIFENHVVPNRPKGKSPFFVEDFAKIPDIVQNYDSVSFEDLDKNQPTVVYRKAYPDGTILVVEETHTAQGRLGLRTAYREEAGTDLEVSNRRPTTRIPGWMIEQADKKNKTSVRRAITGGIQDFFGKFVLAKVMGSGKVVVCETEDSFVDRVVKERMTATGKNRAETEKEVNVDRLRKSKAVFDERTGKIYLNGNFVNRDNAGSVLAHELVHLAKASPKFQETIKKLEKTVSSLMENGLKSKDPLVKKFWEEVQQKLQNSGELNDPEERVTYFLEVYSKQRGAVPTGVKAKVQELLAKFKEWFDSFFGTKTLTEEDIASLLYRMSQDALVTKQNSGGKIKSSFAGEKGMAYSERATFDRVAAEDMEKSGYDARDIKSMTGWERGADGKWRFEIPDLKIKSSFSPEIQEKMLRGDKSLTVGDVFDAPELFAAYPQIKKASFRMGIDPMTMATLDRDTNGFYDPIGEKVVLNPANAFRANPKVSKAINTMLRATEIIKSLSSKVDVDGIADAKTQDALKTIKGRIQEIVGAPVGVTISGDGSSVKLEGAVSPNRVSWRRDPKTNRLAGMERRSASALRSLITDSQFKKAISDLKTADPELGRDLENYINACANESAYAEAIEKGFSQIIKDLSGADLSTIAHEVQHAIQQEEGFAVGGSETSEGSFEGYKRLAGETEARNVSSRLNMTPEERRNSLASDTEDVERDDQIVKLNDKEAASMSMSKKAPKKKDTKKDEPKKPRKQPIKRELTPAQKLYQESKKALDEIKQKAEAAKNFKEGEEYRKQVAPSVEGYDKLQKGESPDKVVEDEIKDATGEAKDKLTVWQKGLLYLRKVAKTFNDNFLQFTNDLVNDISKECPAAKVWYSELLEWAKDRQKYRDEAQKIFSEFDTLSKESKDEVESILYDSTTTGLWAFDISDWADPEGNGLEGKFAMDPKLSKRFNELAKKDWKAAKVVYDTLKHGYDRFIQIKTKIDTVGKAVFGDKYRSLIKTPKSVMPYVPLTRTGQYNVVWRSNQLKAEHQMIKKLKEQRDALEAAEKEVPSALTNAIKNTEEKIDAMERSADHYIVSRFDSLAEAGDFQAKLSTIQAGNKATLMDIGDQQKKSLTGQANIDRMLSDFEEKFEEHYGKGMGVAMRQTVQEMLLESAQKTMHSATKLRRNIAGANPHVMETFMHHANTDAWMLSNLDHGKNISNAFTALGKEVKEYRDSPNTEDQTRATEINDTLNELSKRYSFLTQREQHSKMDDVIEGMRGFNTFSMLSLKLSYYIQNALQPTMMTMPYLSGEFTFGETVAQMTRSYGEVKKFVGDTYKNAHTVKQKWHAFSSIMGAIQKSEMPQDEKDMLLDMERRNLLDLGAQADFGSFRGNDWLRKTMNKTMTEVGYAARAVELANRYVTATAAYRMMKTKLLSQKVDKKEAEARAKDYAAMVLSKTQGDYSGLNAPSAFNTKWGKMALQFRKFQAIQLNYFLDMAKGSFRKMPEGLSEKEQKEFKDAQAIARSQFKIAIATHLVMAGMNGVPAMTLAYALVGMLAGDDGEESEDTVRRLLREAGLSSDAVDIFLQGAFSGIGVNLSNSVGAGQMFSPVPYTRKGLSEEGGMMELLTNVFGGATGSMLVKLHTGAVQSRDNSNWRPFFEALAPAGIPQLAKAVGLVDMTRDKKTGKKFLTDDEITPWHRLVQGVGLTPAPLERKYRMQNQAFRTQQFFKDEVADLKRRWIKAMEDRDYKAQAQIRKDTLELAKRQRAKGLKPVSVNDLMTALKTWKKEEKLMQKNHGLKLPNSQQGLADILNKVHN